MVPNPFIAYPQAITVACHLRLDGDRLADVRLAVGSAGVRAARAAAAEELLSGAAAAELDNALERTGGLVVDAGEPVEDANGSVGVQAQPGHGAQSARGSRGRRRGTGRR